jgi:hypothetical protein
MSSIETKGEVDAALWNELSKGGSALVELGEYPFSERMDGHRTDTGFLGR